MPPEHWELALDLSRGRAVNPKELERVAKATSQEAARWAFVQWELRKRAAVKFERADSMFFDRDGLEMSSNEQIARFHASLFPPNVLVADLTCGIGADLIALAQRGPVVGYETDPERAELARMNLVAHGLQGNVSHGDGVLAAGDYDYVFADPARRSGAGRLRLLSEYVPNPFSLAKERHRLRIIKLSPMLSDEDLRSVGPATYFVTYKRECREALSICGEGIEPGTAAVEAATDARLRATEQLVQRGDPGRYIFDPDPAAIRAHAIGDLAFDLDLRSVDGTAFLTGDQAVASPWLRGYEVLATEKWDAKLLRAALAGFDARTPDVKTHGHAIRPEEWVKQLKRKGANEIAIFALRRENGLIAVLARPKD